MSENILLQCLKQTLNTSTSKFVWPVMYIFFCISEKYYFSCNIDIDADRYACSHKVRILMRMQIRMGSSLFPTLFNFVGIALKIFRILQYLHTLEISVVLSSICYVCSLLGFFIWFQVAAFLLLLHRSILRHSYSGSGKT